MLGLVKNRCHLHVNWQFRETHPGPASRKSLLVRKSPCWNKAKYANKRDLKAGCFVVIEPFPHDFLA
jgi:hypothetical protein